VSQRIVEIVIGRLITDEQFRLAFLRDAIGALAGLSERGLELTSTEIAALIATDQALWALAADRIDHRLQKASLDGGQGNHSQKASTHHV